MQIFVYKGKSKTYYLMISYSQSNFNLLQSVQKFSSAKDSCACSLSLKEDEKGETAEHERGRQLRLRTNAQTMANSFIVD